MIVLRTMLFTPGNNMRMIYKAGGLGADAIILDLEDAVPISEKETARLFVRDGIDSLSEQKFMVLVRVNALGTGLTEEDCNWAVREKTAGIVLPKTESPEDISCIVRLIEKEEDEKGIPAGRVRLVPLLETARGVLAAEKILNADSRIIAVAFGGLDYARDMGIDSEDRGAGLFLPRAQIAQVACAAGISAIDTPYIDVHDIDGLRRDAESAAGLGFRGKLLIHPRQIASVNDVFSPSREALEYARKVVESFQKARDRGLGAVSLDGKMIDAANFKQATDLLALNDECD